MKYENLREVDWMKVPWAINDTLRSKNASRGHHTYAIAYYHYLAGQFNYPLSDPHELLASLLECGEITKEVHDYLCNAINRTGWTGKDFIHSKFSQEELLAYLVFGTGEDGVFGGEHSTPNGLARLAVELLDIQEGEKVVDFGCGEGHFLIEGALDNPCASFEGIDINSDSTICASIRASIAKNVYDGISDFSLRCANCFDIEPEDIHVDKAFFNYPLGMKFRDLKGGSACFARMIQGLPEYGRPSSADWAFNRYLVDALDQDGKAVAIMTPNRLTENFDSNIRAWFVDNGLIEKVVLLPAGLLQGTSIPAALVVFSKGNEGIRFVDASDVCTKGRRNSMLEDADIAEIVALCNENESVSASEKGRGSASSKSLEAIAEERYSLSPRRHIDGGIKIKNPRKLRDFVESVGRGVTLRASELDELSTKVDTGIRYLAPADISSGIVAEELSCLKELDSRLSRHSVESGCVLIGRAGRPFKVAVVEVPYDTVIIPNANLFVLRLKEDGIDPYYLAAFLNSDMGQEILFRASTGNAMPSLSVDDIKDVEFPMPTEADEKDISESYRAKLDEIRIYAGRLAKAKSELADLFSEEE